MTFSEMTIRERFQAVIQGETPDRVPVMYWINPHMACRMMDEYMPAENAKINRQGRFLWRRFKRRQLDAAEIWRGLPLLLTDDANAEYALQLGADMAFAAAGANAANFVKSIRLQKGHLRFKGPRGSDRGIGGIYMDVIDPVLHSVEDLDAYRFPVFDNYNAIRKFREGHPETCLVAETFGVQDASFTPLWEMSQIMMAMMNHPEKVKAFFKKIWGGRWKLPERASRLVQM